MRSDAASNDESQAQVSNDLTCIHRNRRVYNKSPIAFPKGHDNLESCQVLWRHPAIHDFDTMRNPVERTRETSKVSKQDTDAYFVLCKQVWLSRQ